MDSIISELLSWDAIGIWVFVFKGFVVSVLRDAVITPLYTAATSLYGLLK